MSKKISSIDDSVNKYKDTAGLTTRQLDFGLWYLRSRKKFFIVLLTVLVLLAVTTIGYSLYHFANYLIYGMEQDKKNFVELSSSASLVTNKVNLGSNLSYSDVRVLSSENNNSDLVVAVTNNNPRVLVNLNYYFDVNGAKMGEAEAFVLPGDTKYLVALNQAVASNSSVSLVVEDLYFMRLDRHQISDWDKYRSERFNFLVQDVKFTSAVDSGLSEKISLGRLYFKISNNSAYGYRTVPLIILLKSQGQIIALNRYVVNNFRSGEEKNIELSWPGRLANVNEIEVLPDLNILDAAVYLNYSSL